MSDLVFKYIGNSTVCSAVRLGKRKTIHPIKSPHQCSLVRGGSPPVPRGLPTQGPTMRKTSSLDGICDCLLVRLLTNILRTVKNTLNHIRFASYQIEKMYDIICVWYKVLMISPLAQTSIIQHISSSKWFIFYLFLKKKTVE